MKSAASARAEPLNRLEAEKSRTNGFTIAAHAGKTPGDSCAEVTIIQTDQNANTATIVENKLPDQSENATAEATQAIIELSETAAAIAR
jgi:hypothetical protein